MLRACVVGSGPAGFYTAKYLLRATPRVCVDMLEALPTPFGLVRSGVAPDHPEVKAVQNDFEAVAEAAAAEGRFRFLGNVRAGRDVGVRELREAYGAVVLAHGAEGDRRLGVPGEDALRGVHSARSFVGWYNGHPDHASEPFAEELAACGDSRTAVVVGQGNVAVDVARMLLAPGELLRGTDMADHALDALEGSGVRRVVLLGRRGPVQGAFTIKELRELTRLPGCAVRVPDARDMDEGYAGASAEEMAASRAVRRKADLLRATHEAAEGGGSDGGGGAAARELQFRFFSSPTALEEDPARPGRVGAVSVERTRLEGPPGAQRAVPTGETDTIPCGLVLRSIGYRAHPADASVPFDERSATVAHEAGRAAPGLYASGWVKRGPSGIIGTNIADARETVATVLADLEAGALRLDTAGADGLPPAAVAGAVAWDGWRRIDAAERARGAACAPPRPRVKMARVDEMLEAARV